MMNFIDSTASDNLKMLQKVSDPALLVDWVVRTAEHWERRYAQKRDEKYDISQFVLAVMLETITEVFATHKHHGRQALAKERGL